MKAEIGRCIVYRQRGGDIEQWSGAEAVRDA